MFKIGETTLLTFIQKSKGYPLELCLNLKVPLPNLDNYYDTSNLKSMSSIEELTFLWNHLESQCRRFDGNMREFDGGSTLKRKRGAFEIPGVPPSLKNCCDARFWNQSKHISTAKKSILESRISSFEKETGKIFLEEFRTNQSSLEPFLKSWCEDLGISIESAVSFVTTKLYGSRSKKLMATISRIKHDRLNCPLPATPDHFKGI